VTSTDVTSACDGENARRPASSKKDLRIAAP
jgi:hypothetical protein